MCTASRQTFKGVHLQLQGLLQPCRQGLREANTKLTQTDRGVRKGLGITCAPFTFGRQSHIWKTHVEDSPHMWKTVYSGGRQSTHVEDSLHWWKTVYNSALTRGKHTFSLMKHRSSSGMSRMLPGNGLELSIKVQGGEGVDTLLHCFPHGRMAQDAPNLRWLHVLNRQTCYMP